ncbi:hypothetical protein C8J56DRAFT_899311 [Mycena floridula]|nr:hypothetical protein C8J56DRAFT_899311 [Mycena floridula]
MLSAGICAIDHSFMITKQITKIDGGQVFVRLLTVTNEKGDNRVGNVPLLNMTVFPDYEWDTICLERSSELSRRVPVPVLIMKQAPRRIQPQHLNGALLEYSMGNITTNAAGSTSKPSDKYSMLKKLGNLLSVPDEETRQYLAIRLDTEYNVDIPQLEDISLDTVFLAELFLVGTHVPVPLMNMQA